MKQPSILLTLVTLLLLVSAVPASAGPDESETVQSYEISWWTVDGGGGTFSSGGDYDLGGTIGQPDTGTAIGGGYALSGGFWAWWGGDTFFLPLVLRSY